MRSLNLRTEPGGEPGHSAAGKGSCSPSPSPRLFDALAEARRAASSGESTPLFAIAAANVTGAAGGDAADSLQRPLLSGDDAAAPGGGDSSSQLQQQQRVARDRALYANCFALLVSESSRGLVLASLFAYAESVARGSSLSGRDLLGYAVASFSAGRLLSSVLLAVAAERGTPYARILVLCFVIQLLGLGLFLGAGESGASGALPAAALVVSRFVLGFGSGTLPTCRAVVADLTSTSERTRSFAALSFAKFFGACAVARRGRLSRAVTAGSAPQRACT